MINTTHHFGLLMPDDNEYVRVTDINDNMYKLDGILYDMKTSNESQSDWNTNDNKSPSYVKNRPFYSEEVELDVWEFELPVVNEETGEGLFPTLPIPDADFSQFTDGQELEYEVYAGGELQGSDTSVFIKSVDVRKMFEGTESVTIDTDVPDTLMGMGHITEFTEINIIFGITMEFTDFVHGIAVIHNTPNYVCIIDSLPYGGNEELPVQVKFKNFRNKVEQVHQIPEKYLKQTENKKWKYEYNVATIPFENQPTVAKGSVTKLKPNSFYFLELSLSTSTFKLCYGTKRDGTHIYVDDTLEFNLNNAWDTSSNNFTIIHCISVDTEANKAVFGRAMNNDTTYSDYIIHNGTKNIKIMADIRTINSNLETSIIPKQSNGGAVFSFVLSAGTSYSDCYNCDSYVTKPVILNSSNTITVVEKGAEKFHGTVIVESLSDLPFCPYGKESSINVPYYNGLTHYEIELKVSNDRRSIVGNGNVTGICWEEISEIKQATPVDVSSIQISYPINYYFRLLDTEKKLLFVENEGNPVSHLMLTELCCLAGSSITIEGEVE